jgi:hypothetical protein
LVKEIIEERRKKKKVRIRRGIKEIEINNR